MEQNPRRKNLVSDLVSDRPLADSPAPTLAIVECVRLDRTFETSFMYIFFKPRALFLAFIAVFLSKYHANKTSNLIIQFSRFDLEKLKNTVYLYIPFALFRL